MRELKRLPAGGRLLVLDETTLRHLPPLRAAWALRGQQAQVHISGKNARRPLFGTLDLRTGRRVLLIMTRRRLADYHRFFRRLRHGVGACGALWLLLDRHGSHCSPSSLRLAELNTVYKKVIAQLNPKGVDALKEAQRAWVIFRDKAAAAYGNGEEGGSLEGLMYIRCQEAITQNRTKELAKRFITDRYP